MNFFGFFMHGGDEVDLAPLVDIAFLLLTFFMMTTVFRTNEEVKIEVPSSNSASKEPQKKFVTVIVSDSSDKGGTRVVINMDEYKTRVIAFEGTPYSKDAAGLKGIEIKDWRKEMREILLRARQADPSQVIVLKADKGAKFYVVNEIMLTMKQVKFDNVQMITQMEK
jgi:biopolymer transport protein ExbD